MTRIKGGTMSHRKHKKLLKKTRGYQGKVKNIYRLARTAVIKAGENAFRDRRDKRGNLRRLWIARLSAALRAKGYKYNTFINQQKKKNILLDRKILADLAATNEAVFNKIVEKVMAAS